MATVQDSFVRLTILIRTVVRQYSLCLVPVGPTTFYARQLYRQVLLTARISYGNSVRLSVRLSGVSRSDTESRPLGEEIPLERGHQRGVPPKKA